MDQVSKAAEHLRHARKVMVLSGAGMSTAAGIPDFRSAGGLYGTSSLLLDSEPLLVFKLPRRLSSQHNCGRARQDSLTLSALAMGVRHGNESNSRMTCGAHSPTRSVNSCDGPHRELLIDSALRLLAAFQV